MTDNVIQLSKYKKDLWEPPTSVEDEVEEITIEYIQQNIELLNDYGMDPYETNLGNEMVAISMLFRAMIDKQYGRENHLQNMLDVMTKDMRKTEEDKNDE
tara:strand:- start:816 stop:1115 length:300 start_codon:yes stop_codon:yes gene_type:complete